jgi:hypothetical protein
VGRGVGAERKLGESSGVQSAACHRPSTRRVMGALAGRLVLTFAALSRAYPDSSFICHRPCRELEMPLTLAPCAGGGI